VEPPQEDESAHREPLHAFLDRLIEGEAGCLECIQGAECVHGNEERSREGIAEHLDGIGGAGGAALFDETEAGLVEEQVCPFMKEREAPAARRVLLVQDDGRCRVRKRETADLGGRHGELEHQVAEALEALPPLLEGGRRVVPLRLLGDGDAEQAACVLSCDLGWGGAGDPRFGEGPLRDAGQFDVDLL
jgi:hypothetical protein